MFQVPNSTGNEMTCSIATALIVNKALCVIGSHLFINHYYYAQEMGGALKEHLITDTQMKLYMETVLTVLKRCSGEPDIDVQVTR